MNLICILIVVVIPASNGNFGGMHQDLKDFMESHDNQLKHHQAQQSYKQEFRLFDFDRDQQLNQKEVETYIINNRRIKSIPTVGEFINDFDQDQCILFEYLLFQAGLVSEKEFIDRSMEIYHKKDRNIIPSVDL